jgi:hypothetical protein
VSVTADLDAPHAARGDGFSDALTISFADVGSRVYGTARLGISGGANASGLVLLFDGAEVATVAVESAVAVEDAATWDAITAAGLDVETVEPLRAWRLSFAGEDGSLDLEVEALAEPFALDPGEPVAKLGGMNGFEQPLRVRGTAQLAGRRVGLDGLGQRGRSWGEPDWDVIGRTRVLGAWFPETALSIAAIAPHGADGHDRDALSAVVFDHGASEPHTSRVADPRLSTTFDEDGRQRRAALELWMSDDGPVRRAAGEVVCGTTLDLGRLRLDCAFLDWRMEGQHGVGRYDVLRRAATTS